MSKGALISPFVISVYCLMNVFLSNDCAVNELCGQAMEEPCIIVFWFSSPSEVLD